MFVLSLRRLIMRASFGSSCSIGLRIEGRSTKDSKSARPGGGLGSLIDVVVGVLPVGYPCGSEYLRAAVRYADANGP